MRPRVSVSADQIDAVVRAFYARVRKDPELGPVFAVHVSDWTSHEERIARFWRNAILGEKVFDGNPMQKHRAAGNVEGMHFPRWLALFDETVHHELPPDTAEAWSELAHRIGRSLKLGLTFKLPENRAVPDLKSA